MAIFPKSIYRLNTIPMEVPIACLAEMGKLLLKHI
jgi:hypothetical protein